MKFKPLLLSLLGGGVGAMMIAATMPEKAMVERSEATANALEEAMSVGAENLSVPQNRTHSKQVAMTANELYGEWILTYTSAVSSRPYPGGHALEISPIAGTDSVQFSKWYFTNMPGPKGKADLAKGTIFIPTQYVGRTKNGNDSVDVWFAPRLSGGGPNWQDGAGVTLTMKEDGNFSIDTQYGWGLFIYNTTSGFQWTSATGAGTLYKPNGTMKYAKNDKPNDTIVTPVYMKQTGGTVTVTNFYDVGTNVDFQLKTDSTISVTDQMAYQNTTAAYYLVYISKYDSTTGSISYNKSFTTLKGSNPNEILLPPWSLFGTTSTGGGSWFGLYDWAEISGDITFTYPMEIGLNGSGTQASPYEIGSVEDWNKFADYISFGNNCADNYVKLTNDIDFNGKEITPCTSDFAGNFNGSGFSLKNFTLTTTVNSQSIFNTVTVAGTISNLTLKGTVSSEAATYVAGLIGTLYGTLDNVVNESSVTGKNAAGLVGTVETGALINKCVNKGHVDASSLPAGGISALARYGVTYTDCVNEGVLTKKNGASSLGGITGTSGNSTFINCSNVGKFDTDSLVFYIGGIVGNANGITDANTLAPLTLKNCFNTADILGKGLMGGLVGGRQYGANKTGIDIQDCYNTGNLSFPNSSYNSYPVGGIIGQPVQGNIINCYNTGNISGTRTTAVGGIFGKALQSGSYTTPLIVRDCYNTGNIGVNTSASAVGGIGGYLSIASHAEVVNCYNTGNVAGTYTVGGVVGQADKTDNLVQNCWNTGNVTSQYKWTGGIIGSTIKSTTKVEYCWNSGIVSTEGTDGGDDTKTTTATGNGIGGIIGRSGAKISNSYNLGCVKGASQVGGIVGLTELDSAQVVKCYNIGEIIAPADSCGAILGVKTVSNPTRFGEKNKVEDCYYVSDYLSIGTNNIVGTPKTMAELASGSFNMGEGWSNVGEACTPTFTYCKTEAAALVGVAQVVLNDCNYNKVIRDFKVGVPAGVEWSSNNAVVSFSGSKGIIDNKSDMVPVVLTAKAGNFSKQVNLIIDGKTGLNAIENTLNVVSREFYTLDGIATVAPVAKDGKVYVVILTLSDGSKRIIKMAN